jgi:putative oxidoreductase
MTSLMGHSYSQPLGAAVDANEGSRARTIVLWTLQVIAAGAFVASGIPKLLGVPAMVQMFDAIGIGQWFRYLTGTVEVVSGLLLLAPSLALFGAIALAATMIGAIVTHLFIVGGSPAPAIVLLLLTSAIAWMRRSR